MTDYLPRRQPTDHDIALFTFEDAVDQVLDAFKLQRTDWMLRQARRAVLDAYRDLPQRHKWPYFERRYQFATVAPQTTGTVAYDHTGGTYERELTLTGATWPANAWEYGLVIGTEQYAIEDYKSSTVVTLAQHQNPGTDVAALTAYTLYKAFYPLPGDFRRGSHILQLSGASIDPYYTSYQDVLNAMWSFTTPGQPLRYTVVNDGSYYGVNGILFGPAPSTAQTFTATYAAKPRPLFYENYHAGTVGISSTTVTGVDTAFDSKMVGSIIRFPDSTSKEELPTGPAGSTSGAYNPYVAERTITAVASTTSLTIDATVSETVTASAYTLSDPVDLEPFAMRTAFIRLAEFYYAIYANKVEERGYRRGLANDAMLFAMENSARFRDAAASSGDEPLNYSVTMDVSSS